MVGELFRIGGQHSRRYSKESVQDQFLALNSQIKLINLLKDKYSIDIKLYTNFNYELNEEYKYITNKIKEINKNTTRYFYVPEKIYTYENLTNKILKQNINKSYEKIFLLRIDLILKDFCIDQIMKLIEEESIVFPNPQFYPITTPNNNFRVSEVLFILDKKFYFIKDIDNIGLNHEFLDKINIKYDPSKNDIKFLINTFHDPDTQKDWNPIYKMVGRQSQKRWIINSNINTEELDQNLNKYIEKYCKDFNFIKFIKMKENVDLYIKEFYAN